ncbi:phosphoribosylglycinamide formyltransferase [Aliidongia dinghuensis]|uniref:Phosphoribosylglycinamide formyltransferase n=1 Tax=Aliidongia dinghuensis TaxID=1867774 RepID=A0A8J3E5Y6_9PROT|nr:phosphoribosylglycinamide formyltransferase [Aliidongia dinghuensis]GGF25323.1 phosphoribosylglycinamide formyltransferase [Aliidongia dinghuensis]
MARLKVGVLVSGNGSNLQALIDLCRRPGFPAEIVLVVSNKPGVKALDRAARAGIATAVVPHEEYPDRLAFDQAIDAALRTADVEFICLAGFMRVLSEMFVELWRDRIINIHPSLLPSFKGLHTHRQALEAGVRFHGCTVHIVRPRLDDGPILVQAVVPVLPGDDEQTLAARVLKAEHKIYPQALRLVAEGRVTIEGTRARIDDQFLGALEELMNPPDRPRPPLPSPPARG